MSNAKAAAPALDTGRVGDQMTALFGSAVTWLQERWLEILIAIGAGVAIALLLFWLRSLGARLAARCLRAASISLLIAGPSPAGSGHSS